MAIAIFGLITGVALLGSGSIENTFISVGVVAILLVILIGSYKLNTKFIGLIILCEVLWKKGRAYSLIYDFVIGMSVVFFQLGIYIFGAARAFPSSDGKN